MSRSTRGIPHNICPSSLSVSRATPNTHLGTRSGSDSRVGITGSGLTLALGRRILTEEASLCGEKGPRSNFSAHMHIAMLDEQIFFPPQNSTKRIILSYFILWNCLRNQMDVFLIHCTYFKGAFQGFLCYVMSFFYSTSWKNLTSQMAIFQIHCA